MDFREPVASLIPGSTGRILEVLGNSEVDLNASTIARLARVSAAQASRVLPRLAKLGVASARHVPPSTLYALNREHLAARAIKDLVNTPEKVFDRLRATASRLRPAPLTVAVFGSAARRAATGDSDIDVLIVRPTGVTADDDHWYSEIADWSDRVQRMTGNVVNVLEYDADEVSERLTSDSAIWQDIQRESVIVFGRELSTYVR